ncbi:MAG: hypothetical protein JST82_00710 [Bacteroidetes bacterium]|nr:hypothetical protein [Bacteroidota bacterium]
MRTKYIIPGLILATFLAMGCYRKQDKVTPAPYALAGKGGTAKLLINAKHHDYTLDSCTIYLRYDAVEMPTIYNWRFDDSMKVKPQSGGLYAIFDSLKQGNYYIWAKGWDPNYAAVADSVIGGTAFKVIDTVTRTYNITVNTFRVNAEP